MTRIDDLRRQKDEYFGRDPGSPLTGPQRSDFRGLRYFPEDPALRLEVDLEPPDDPSPLDVQTSTGDVQTYVRVGRFGFAVNGHAAALTIFEGQHGLFLPFVDALAGTDTYPGGRYLEPERLASGRYVVDFNLAYNPYCAYNENWSCPLTPFENRLGVPIRAGEMIYRGSH